MIFYEYRTFKFSQHIVRAQTVRKKVSTNPDERRKKKKKNHVKADPTHLLLSTISIIPLLPYSSMIIYDALFPLYQKRACPATGPIAPAE